MGMKLPREIEAKILAQAGPDARATDPYAELPIPPSVNHLFVTRGNRRFKSELYREWLRSVDAPLRRLARPTRFPVAIEVTVFGPINWSRDLDNLLKPLGDAMVATGVLPGDSVQHVAKWSVEWKPRACQSPVALVRLVPIEGV